MNYDKDYLFNVVDRIKYVSKYKIDELPAFIESYSKKQYESKEHLIKQLNSLNIFTTIKHATVLACWYGNVLFPMLIQYIKKIDGYDIDSNCRIMSKNIPIKNCKIHELDIWNCDFHIDKHLKTTNLLINLNTTDLLINTSCEHIPPMKTWKHWEQIKKGCYIALQSNNMFSVQDHTNCVQNILEFIDQMPKEMSILKVSEIPIYSDEKKYKRFTIIGQM